MKLSILQFLSVATALIKLDFDIYYGDSVPDINHKRNHEPGYIGKRDDTAEMTLFNQQTWYLAELYFGSNQDKISVLVDTGSSDLWVHSHDVVCQVSGQGLQESNTDPAVTNTCTSYGSFNTGESDTFKRNDTSEFLINYADNTFAYGIWGYDTVGFEDTSDGTTKIKNLSFAVANATDSEMGVLGIGLYQLESVDVFYENLPMKMKNQGLIKKNAYSLYLNQPDAKSGSVLFGGVDHAKYDGKLLTVPMIPTTGSGTQYRTTVGLSGMSFKIPTLNTTIFENQNIAVLLDSGTTFSYFRSAVLDPIIDTLGGTYNNDIGGYTVPCTTDSDVYFELDFNGVTIKVPLPDLLLPYGNKCVLAILKQDDSNNYDTIGDNILRNGYFVFDLDDHEVSIAQVKFTNDNDIEEIKSSIPSAIKADGYSSTDLASISVSSLRSLSYSTDSLSSADESASIESESEVSSASGSPRSSNGASSTGSASSSTENSDDSQSSSESSTTSDSSTSEVASTNDSSTTTEGSNNSSNNDGNSSPSSSASPTSSNQATTPSFVSFSMLVVSLVMYGLCV